jgi:hypothetical protein
MPLKVVLENKTDNKSIMKDEYVNSKNLNVIYQSPKTKV